jgi:hypothetical protein
MYILLSTSNEDLNSALGKLGFSADHPRFQSLPATRDDPLWYKLEQKYKLDEFELGA